MPRLRWHDHAARRDAHGGHHHLHDAPRPMAFALIVLAVGSVVAGYVGLPPALGGSAALERFLEPSFEARGAASRGVCRRRKPQERAAEASESLELGLMGVSTVVALGGIGIAVFFFLREPRGRARGSPSGSPACTRCSQNKYYVDEIYDATIVQPIRIVSEQGLWKIVDARVIDGAVNGVAESGRAAERAAAPAADRIGPRVRRVAVPRRGGGAGVLLVAHDAARR